MEFLGVGPSELVFIIIIALIVLGPKDMQKAGRTLGKWMKKVVTSDGWKLFQQTSREIQTLPTRLMREASLEDLNKDLQKELKGTVDTVNKATRISQPVSNGTSNLPAAKEPENTILPSPPPPSNPASNDEEKNG